MLLLCYVIRRWLKVDQDRTSQQRPNSKNASVGKKLVENKREGKGVGSRKKTRLGDRRKEEINIYNYDFCFLYWELHDHVCLLSIPPEMSIKMFFLLTTTYLPIFSKSTYHSFFTSTQCKWLVISSSREY